MITLSIDSNKEDAKIAKQISEMQLHGFKLHEMYKENGRLYFNFVGRKIMEKEEQEPINAILNAVATPNPNTLGGLKKVLETFIWDYSKQCAVAKSNEETLHSLAEYLSQSNKRDIVVHEILDLLTKKIDILDERIKRIEDGSKEQEQSKECNNEQGSKDTGRKQKTQRSPRNN